MTSPEVIFTICRRTTASPYYILKSLISELIRIKLMLTESIFFTVVRYILKIHPCIYEIPNRYNSYLVLTILNSLRPTQCRFVHELVFIKRPLFAENDDCRRKQHSRTWSFHWWKQKQVKFDLFNVSKKNDADLSCCCSFFFFGSVRCSNVPAIRGF